MPDPADKKTLHGLLGERWLDLGQQVPGAVAAPAAWQKAGRHLIRQWQRWPRRYHAGSHLLACLRHHEAAWVPLSPSGQTAVAWALWFHDAIYVPWRRDNEARSAAWAISTMQRFGCPAADQQLVSHLIMATAHQAMPEDDLACYVVDIDLAILGQNEMTYRQFEAGVRAEYRWVPMQRYLDRRRQVLQGFLLRPRIYHTEAFHAHYEQVARHNLAHAIACMDRTGHPFT